MNKFKALSEDIDHQCSNIHALQEFNLAKTNQQFLEFYSAYKEDRLPRKVKLTSAELILFKRLSEYEKDKGERILELYGSDFDIPKPIEKIKNENTKGNG